jgi:hypothetical protein
MTKIAISRDCRCYLQANLGEAATKCAQVICGFRAHFSLWFNHAARLVAIQDFVLI